MIYISNIGGEIYVTCSPCAELLTEVFIEDDIDAATVARMHNLTHHREDRLPIFKANGDRYYSQ